MPKPSSLAAFALLALGMVLTPTFAYARKGSMIRSFPSTSNP
jgi:hypothetical protein